MITYENPVTINSIYLVYSHYKRFVYPDKVIFRQAFLKMRKPLKGHDHLIGKLKFDITSRTFQKQNVLPSGPCEVSFQP